MKRAFLLIVLILAPFAMSAAEVESVALVRRLVHYVTITGDNGAGEQLALYFAAMASNEAATRYRAVARRFRDGSWEQMSGAVSAQVAAFGFSPTGTDAVMMPEWLVRDLLSGLSRENLPQRQAQATALAKILPKQRAFAHIATELIMIESDGKQRDEWEQALARAATHLRMLQARKDKGDMSVEVLQGLEKAKSERQRAEAALAKKAPALRR